MHNEEPKTGRQRMRSYSPDRKSSKLNAATTIKCKYIEELDAVTKMFPLNEEGYGIFLRNKDNINDKTFWRRDTF